MLMRFLLLTAMLLTLGPTLSVAVDPTSQVDSALTLAHAASQANTASEPPKAEEHGLSAKAVEIARPFNFPVTNSMVVSWIVALGLIVFAQVATREMKQVPGSTQNFLEWLIEGLYKFMVGIIGEHLTQRTFWYFATIFIFILSANWMGLIPGVGSMGWGHQTAHGFRIEQPLLRGANADVNMTLAMALIFFASWIVWSFREVGVRGFFKELFAPKGDTEGALKVLMVVVMDARTPESKPERRRFATMPSELRRLSTWLQERGVEEAVMESTAQYWRSVWLELEPHMCLHLAQVFSNRAPRGRKHDFKDAERVEADDGP